jgi:hypothetical protein
MPAYASNPVPIEQLRFITGLEMAMEVISLPLNANDAIPFAGSYTRAKNEDVAVAKLTAATFMAPR